MFTLCKLAQHEMFIIEAVALQYKRSCAFAEGIGIY